MKPWLVFLVYSVIRAVLFGGIFVALMIYTSTPYWIAAIIAAIAGLCISYIFFGRQRNALALRLAERKARGETNLDSAEDEALDRAQ